MLRQARTSPQVDASDTPARAICEEADDIVRHHQGVILRYSIAQIPRRRQAETVADQERIALLNAERGLRELKALSDELGLAPFALDAIESRLGEIQWALDLLRPRFGMAPPELAR